MRRTRSKPTYQTAQYAGVFVRAPFARSRMWLAKQTTRTIEASYAARPQSSLTSLQNVLALEECSDHLRLLCCFVSCLCWNGMQHSLKLPITGDDRGCLAATCRCFSCPSASRPAADNLLSLLRVLTFRRHFRSCRTKRLQWLERRCRDLGSALSWKHACGCLRICDAEAKRLPRIRE